VKTLKTLAAAVVTAAAAFAPQAAHADGFPAMCTGTKALNSTGNYRNLIYDYGIDTWAGSNAKLQAAYNQLMVNGTSDQMVLHTTSDGLDYIVNERTDDSAHPQDIRSEGMSYGMMIAVQMNDKATFDKLWQFAIKYMLNYNNSPKDHFAWRLNPTSPFAFIDDNAASDGEEYFAMALKFAHNRFGSSSYDLSNMDATNYDGWHERVKLMIQNKLFNKTEHQVKLTPTNDFTDPSYHLPAFYELWDLWGGYQDYLFFYTAAGTSRTFFTNATKWNTAGLTSDYANYNGTAYTASWNSDSNKYAPDSWRVIQNMAMDYAWCSNDTTLKALILKQLNTFNNAGGTGARQYGDHYDFSQNKFTNTNRGQALMAMNASAAIALDINNSTEKALGKAFMQDLYNASVPSGNNYRYFNGLVYLLGMLHVTGNYKVYNWTYEPTWIGSSNLQSVIADHQASQQAALSVINATASPLQNFTAQYFFTTENGKTPVLSDLSTPNSSVSLVQVDKLVWAVRLNYAGKTLAAGASFATPETFGLAYTDGSPFDVSNDYSFTQNGSTNHVAVYNSAGTLVMGSTPNNQSPSYQARVRATWGGRMITSTGSPNDSDVKGQPLTSGWNSQDWMVEPVPYTGYVRIKNKVTGKYLNVQNQDENARVVTYDLNPTWDSEIWQMENASPGPGVRFRNTWSNRYLTLRDTSDYSGVFSQAGNSGWPSQVWKVE
jgi:oligosaccharide reducing-end xylanase